MIEIPTIRSAAKRLRQNKKRRRRNDRRKKAIKEAVKETNEHISNGDKEKAEATLAELKKAVDKAVAKNVIHKNKGARIKSKITRRVNDL